MAKYPISKGVPKNVTVGEPSVSEWHRKLGGSQAKPGSPAGREAKPSPHIAADFKRPEVPRSN